MSAPLRLFVFSILLSLTAPAFAEAPAAATAEQAAAPVAAAPVSVVTAPATASAPAPTPPAAAPAAATTPATATPAAKPTSEIPSGLYKSDPAHTSVTWRLWHMGLSLYTARFTKMSAQLTLDADKPENSALKATVETQSVKTDFPFPDKKNFDKEVAEGADYLDGVKNPTITFVSKKIELNGKDKAKVTGDLTLRGITKPVVMDVMLNGTLANHPMMNKPALGFSGTMTIKRSDFGMPTSPYIGDDVQVIIQTEMLKE